MDNTNVKVGNILEYLLITALVIVLALLLFVFLKLLKLVETLKKTSEEPKENIETIINAEMLKTNVPEQQGNQPPPENIVQIPSGVKRVSIDNGKTVAVKIDPNKDSNTIDFTVKM